MDKFLFNSAYSCDLHEGIMGCQGFTSLTQPGGAFIPFMDFHFGFSGCQLLHTSIVKYWQGYITYYEKQNNSIGISFEFTGSAMALFKYLDRNYIVHISLHGPNTSYDTRTYWETFLNKIASSGLGHKFRDFKLFKPFDQRARTILFQKGKEDPNFLRIYDCCGIIDEQGDCYSAILSKTDHRAIQIWRNYCVKEVKGNLNKNNIEALIL